MPFSALVFLLFIFSASFLLIRRFAGTMFPSTGTIRQYDFNLAAAASQDYEFRDLSKGQKRELSIAVLAVAEQISVIKKPNKTHKASNNMLTFHCNLWLSYLTSINPFLKMLFCSWSNNGRRV
jgi:hypothetical protein